MTPRYWSYSESKISARGGAVGVAVRRRDARDQLLEHLGHAVAGLRRDAQDLVGLLADQVGDLLGHALGLGAGQVDLVQARDQLEPGVDGEVGVRDGLRLDALGGVDDQQRALAGGERARDLVGEVDVARACRSAAAGRSRRPSTSKKTRTAWALIVIPRSRSRSIESSSCARIERGSTVCVVSRMRSASVDFPWSMWAMIEKFRMWAWSDMGPGQVTRRSSPACAARSRRSGAPPGCAARTPRPRRRRSPP